MLMMMFSTIIEQSIQYSLIDDPGDCNMIRANGVHLNVLFHPVLVIHMMKTRLDSQVAAKLTVKLYNVVQLCYDSLSTWVCMHS